MKRFLVTIGALFVIIGGGNAVVAEEAPIDPISTETAIKEAVVSSTEVPIEPTVVETAEPDPGEPSDRTKCENGTITFSDNSFNCYYPSDGESCLDGYLEEVDSDVVRVCVQFAPPAEEPTAEPTVGPSIPEPTVVPTQAVEPTVEPSGPQATPSTDVPSSSNSGDGTNAASTSIVTGLVITALPNTGSGDSLED